MATTHSTRLHTDTSSLNARAALLLAVYAAAILATIATATAAAYSLAGPATGLGQFVLLAGGWLAVVSASPEVGKRVALRFDRVDFATRTSRSSKAVSAVTQLFVR